MHNAREAAGSRPATSISSCASPIREPLPRCSSKARGAPPSAAIAAGAAIFLAAKLLKWWAILTLGRFWTFRVIVVPGAALVADGPYRWLRHPNYVGVMGELAGVALMTGAIVSGVAGIATFGALIMKRIALEERALRAAPR